MLDVHIYLITSNIFLCVQGKDSYVDGPLLMNLNLNPQYNNIFLLLSNILNQKFFVLLGMLRCLQIWTFLDEIYLLSLSSGRERELIEELSLLKDPTAARTQTQPRPSMLSSLIVDYLFWYSECRA